MRLRHIDIFHAVMLTGSVSGAARLLNMTQPAATRLLQHAEQQLGFPLFNRVKQRMLPTEQAKVLFAEAQAAYMHVERFERLAKRLRHAAGGQLSILATTVLAQRIVPPVIKSLNQRFPEARIEIGTGHSNTISIDVAEHRADVGLVFSPTVIPENLELISLSESSLCCVYPAAWGNIQSLPHGLANYPLIGMQDDDPLAHVLYTWLECRSLSPVPLLFAHSRPLVLQMIEQGIGWSILDIKNIEHYVENPDAIYWEVISDLPKVEVVLLVARQRAKNAVLDAFIQRCRQVEGSASTGA